MKAMLILLVALAVVVVPGEAAAHACEEGDTADIYVPLDIEAASTVFDDGHIHIGID